MNDESKELARIGLDISAEYRSIDYIANRDRLNCALGGTALESHNEALANAEFLKSFVSLLPRDRVKYWGSLYNLGEFALSSQADARALQSAALWRAHSEFDEDINHYVKSENPFYVLGKRTTKNSSEWLLHAVFRDGFDRAVAIPQSSTGKAVGNSQVKSPVLLVRLNSKTAKQIEDRTQTCLIKPFEEAELPVVYNPEREAYVIGPDSPQSATIYQRRIPIPFSDSFKVKSSRWLDGVPAPIMATYNVFDQINHLALLFDKVDETRGLLVNQPEVLNS